ncbi:putative glycosyl transferase [Halobacteriovorax marinus SJ]|uniref:Glycosyl transferase n=1 Tax=Halobacteriovorax marinus (strain ATCC BAA-682 / DSM 15412 / SJ) TaxID=862908 RepID=E1WZ65_HALMS|nr:glycosyltransferase family 2 protein [Halobacteriovorax marinus]CBW27753.1 putative glycosyl transferase [Halobacteriovorax marinus SJ]
MSPKITFVLPTKDEEKTIGNIIKEINSLSSELNFQISEILVSDDSRDNTKEIALSLGAKVLFGGGKGLGEAMYRGLKAASNTDCDFIISLDTDGQTNLAEISDMTQAINEQKADLVLSSRFKRKDLVSYNYPLINRIGVLILVKFLRYGSKSPLTDSHGGIRIMKKDVASRLEMLGTHTYVQETIFDAAKKGFKIAEIEGRWLPRNGESRVLASIPKYVAYTLPVIILRLGLHMKLLLPIFCTLLLLSIGYLIISLSTTAVVSILISILLIFQVYLFEYLQSVLIQNRRYE